MQSLSNLAGQTTCILQAICALLTVRARIPDGACRLLTSRAPVVMGNVHVRALAEVVSQGSSVPGSFLWNPCQVVAQAAVCSRQASHSHRAGSNVKAGASANAQLVAASACWQALRITSQAARCSHAAAQAVSILFEALHG